MTEIAVTLCTFRRPEVVQTLQSLFDQSLPETVRLRIIVVDNDDTPSGRAAVEAAGQDAPWPVTYLHAPARNISIARNAGLSAAGDAEWIAFLDDDEIADPDWLGRILSCARQTGADAVFGPAIAEYDENAPSWMRARDYHSNHPVRNGGNVITGHTCNSILRWRNTEWRDCRFDLSRGQSGGEDTAYFLTLYRRGARFAICPEAIVREPVSPARLSFAWIARRKYRSGQSFAASASGLSQCLRLTVTSGGKAGICAVAALLSLPVEEKRNFWALRGIMHMGVMAGLLNLGQAAHYGRADEAS